MSQDSNASDDNLNTRPRRAATRRAGVSPLAQQLEKIEAKYAAIAANTGADDDDDALATLDLRRAAEFEVATAAARIHTRETRALIAATNKREAELEKRRNKAARSDKPHSKAPKRASSDDADRALIADAVSNKRNTPPKRRRKSTGVKQEPGAKKRHVSADFGSDDDEQPGDEGELDAVDDGLTAAEREREKATNEYIAVQFPLHLARANLARRTNVPQLPPLTIVDQQLLTGFLRQRFADLGRPSGTPEARHTIPGTTAALLPLQQIDAYFIPASLSYRTRFSQQTAAGIQNVRV